MLDPDNKAMRVRIKLRQSRYDPQASDVCQSHCHQCAGEQAVCIPTKALIEQNGKSFVVVFNSRSDMQIAEVNVKKISGNKTFVNSGVSPGQKVITENELLVFQQLMGD